MDEIGELPISKGFDKIKDAILKFYESTEKNKMIENIKEEKKKYSWSNFTNVLFSLIDKVNN